MEQKKRLTCLINIGSFIVIMALGRLWVQYDQDILPQYLLMPVFIVMISGLMFTYFCIVKPENVRRFSFILSLITCLTAATLSVLEHVIIENDFSLLWKKSVTIWIISFIIPNIVGFGYSAMNKKKPRS